MLATIDYVDTIWIVFAIIGMCAPIYVRRRYRGDPREKTAPRAEAQLLPNRDRRPDCPYCKAELVRNDVAAVIRCPSCEVAHHSECWNENGGCTVLGCDRTRDARRDRGERAISSPTERA